jgi:hypothetical protein
MDFQFPAHKLAKGNKAARAIRGNKEQGPMENEQILGEDENELLAKRRMALGTTPSDSGSLHGRHHHNARYYYCADVCVRWSIQ